jgi:hypothetical protein
VNARAGMQLCSWMVFSFASSSQDLPKIVFHAYKPLSSTPRSRSESIGEIYMDFIRIAVAHLIGSVYLCVARKLHFNWSILRTWTCGRPLSLLLSRGPSMLEIFQHFLNASLMVLLALVWWAHKELAAWLIEALDLKVLSRLFCLVLMIDCSSLWIIYT